MKSGTWKVRSLCRAGSLKTVASQVTVQEVRSVEGGNQPADDYTFFLWKREC
jgi:hypothetical protein